MMQQQHHNNAHNVQRRGTREKKERKEWGEESRRAGYRRSLSWLLLLGGSSLFLGKLMQDVESFLDLGTQTLRRIEQAQELSIVHLQQHASDLSGEVRLRSIAT